MTDAEFMAEWVAIRKKVILEQPPDYCDSDDVAFALQAEVREELAKLAALDALAGLPDKLGDAMEQIPEGWSHVEDIRIEIEEALYRFRVDMEVAGQNPRK